MEVNDNDDENNDNTNLTAILMSIMLNHSTIYSASNQTTVSDFVVMKFLDCLSYFFVFSSCYFDNSHISDCSEFPLVSLTLSIVILRDSFRRKKSYNHMVK